MSKRKSIIWQMPSDEFKKLVENSNTYLEVLKNFYVNPLAGNYKTLKKRIEEEGLDVSHIELNKQSFRGIRKESIPIEEILVENSKYTARGRLKERLLKSGLLKNKCYECGLRPEWNNKPLSLQLEHKNGIANDNRIENLCLLCPNCHSQTDTYAGKNARKHIQALCVKCGIKITRKAKTSHCVKCSSIENGIKQRKVDRPTREELKQLIRNKPFTQIAKSFGVSDNAVRKWCRQYELPHKASEIKQYTDEEWKLI